MGGAVELARREARVMGEPLPTSPHEAIVRCIEIASGELEYATLQVAGLEPDDALIKGRPHAWITVRQAAADRLIMYAQIAAKVGVDERRVQLAERYGQEIADAMRRFALAMGHNPEEQQVRAAIGQALRARAVEGSAVEITR